MGIINKNLKIRDFMFSMKSLLNCSSAEIARLVGINPSSICNNNDKTLLEIEKKKTGKRLINLGNVSAMFYERGLCSEVIKSTLEKRVFERLEINEKDSVSSAIKSDLYTLNVILFIADRALIEVLEEKKKEDTIFNKLMKDFNSN